MIIIKKKKIIKIIKIFKILNWNKNKNFILKINYNKLFFIFKNNFIELNIKLKIKKKIKKLFIFNLKNFYDILKNIDKNKIKIKIKKNEIELKNKKIKYKIKKIKEKYKTYKKKKNIFKFKIKKKDIINIINLFNSINKNQIEEKNFINILINKNIKFIITDNYQLCYYKIKNNINKKKNIILNKKILIIINQLINKIKNKIKFNFDNKFIKIKLKNLFIKSKIKKKNFIIIKEFKKIFKNYIIIKKNILQKFLNIFLNFYTKENEILKILIYKNLLKAIKKNENNQIIKILKIRYYGKNFKFLINGINILNFLKSIDTNKDKYIILNFSKKNNLIITLPNLKNFKYCTKIIKF